MDVKIKRIILYIKRMECLYAYHTSFQIIPLAMNVYVGEFMGLMRGVKQPKILIIYFQYNNIILEHNSSVQYVNISTRQLFIYLHSSTTDLCSWEIGLSNTLQSVQLLSAIEMS